jgi:prolyl oligopeptidase
MDWKQTATVCALIGCSAAGLAAESGPPAAPLHDVAEDYYGTTVHDPYRWMEQGGDDFAAWLRNEGAFTRSILDRIPGRQKLLEQMKALDQASDQVGGALHCNGGRWIYSKTPISSDVAKLFVRDTGGADRILIDPQRFDRGDAHAKMTFWWASWDCKHVAYGISLSGAEVGVLRIADVDRGRDLPEVINDVFYGSPSWLPDGSGFFYTRIEKNPASPSDLSRMQVFLHKLGADPATELPLVGADVPASVSVPPGRWPSVTCGPDSSFAILTLSVPGGDLMLYAARLEALAGAQTPLQIPWQPISAADDHARAIALHGGDLYVAIARDAPRVKVVKLSLAAPDLAPNLPPNLAHAATVVPERRGAIENIDAAADALYMQEVEGGPIHVLRLPWNGDKAEAVPMPPGQDFSSAYYHVLASAPGATLYAESWTLSPRILSFDPAVGQTTDTGLQVPVPIDFSDIETREAMVAAPGGTEIPLSILVKRGTALDHSHPTLLEGYGAYRNVRTPSFDRLRRAWFDQGGVYAIAHVRGGGEFGEPWHQAGMRANKLNTITDFIACAQYLIDKGYTSPQRLGAVGGSAGGILVGGAIDRRPDLFAAVLINAGLVDTLRLEQMPIGAYNTPEFGSVATADGFKMLMAADAYQQVKDGVRYPAVLQTTGLHDARVPPWQPGKLAARLQVASTSGRPILLRVDAEAGHLGGTRAEGEATRADQYAFLLWQMGITGFRPSPLQ